MAKNPWDNDPVVGNTGGVFQLPRSQEQVSEEARKRASDMREQIRLSMAQQSEARQAAEWNASHNQDGSPKSPDAVSIPADQAQVTGKDFLAKIPPSDAAQVKALAEGRMAFPAGKAASSPYWQQRLAQVAQYDPEFDAVNYNARAATRRDFTSGTSSRNIKALNTAIGHIGQLADQIGGTAAHGGFPLATTVNSIQNAMSRGMGDPGVTKYEQTAGAVAGELTQVFRGTGGAEADIQRYMSELNSSGSEEQKKAAVANIMGLLKSRLDALNDQYTKGMGTTATPLELLDDHSKKALGSYLPGFDTGDGGGTPPLAGPGSTNKSVPIPPAMNAEYRNYVREHNGRLDPADYANFRAQLDAKYGFPANPSDPRYLDEAKNLNNAAKNGLPVDPVIPPTNAGLVGSEKLKASIFGSPAGAALMGAGSLGGAADEVAAGVRSLGGENYDTALAQTNAMRQAAASQYPGMTLAGQLGGAMLTGYGAGMAAPALGEAAAGSPIATGSIYGGVNGALENNDNRIGGAFTGAALGAGSGAAGKYVVAPLAERAMRSLAAQKAADVATPYLNRIPGVNIQRNAVPEMSSLDNIAMGVKPDFAAMSQNLRDAQRLGLPYGLADADPKMRMLAGTVTRKSPDARSMAESLYDPRAMGQADRAVSAIDTHLAPITNVEQRGKDLLEAGNIASKPFYNMASERVNPVQPGMEMFTPPTGMDREIAAILNSPTGKEALGRAHKILADRGGSPESVGLVMDSSGNVTLRQGHSFEALDLTKKGLDNIIQDHADAITGKINFSGKPQLQAIEGLRQRLVNRMDEINPNYAEARGAYAPYAQRKDALDAGYNALPKSNVPQRVFDERVSGLTPETLPEAQMGYATSMADQVDKSRLSSDPYNAIYGSPLQQQKVGALFPEGADNFGRINGLERDMSKTRMETLGGSQTAGRLAADESLSGSLGSMALDSLGSMATGGGALNAGMATKLLRGVVGDRLRLKALTDLQGKANSIAPALFDTSNPGATADMIDALAAKYGALQARKAAYGSRMGLTGAIALPAMLRP